MDYLIIVLMGSQVFDMLAENYTWVDNVVFDCNLALQFLIQWLKNIQSKLNENY